MLKIFTIGLLASTLGFVGIESAQACGGGSCAMAAVNVAPTCAATGCTAPAAPAAAKMDHGNHAAIPPATTIPQANAGVRRSYSYEPESTYQVAPTATQYSPAATYRYQGTSRIQAPSHSYQKTDPRRYGGGY